MGICWSKLCNHCKSILIFQDTKTKTYDGLEWNVEYYKCHKCNREEIIYRIPDESW